MGFAQIAYEMRQYVKLIVVTTEGGYTTRYLSSGMSCVLHGLTDQIDTAFYPKEINVDEVLSSTVHTVAATTSDLRRVYELEVDPEEAKKIFNGSREKSLEYGEIDRDSSVYVPNGHEVDEEYEEELVPISETGDARQHKKKKSKRTKKKERKKKKKRKRDKESIDLTNGDDAEDNLDELLLALK